MYKTKILLFHRTAGEIFKMIKIFAFIHALNFHNLISISFHNLSFYNHFISISFHNPTGGVSEVRDDEDLLQWSWMEIRLNAFHWSTTPQNNSS